MIVTLKNWILDIIYIAFINLKMKWIIYYIVLYKINDLEYKFYEYRFLNIIRY